MCFSYYIKLSLYMHFLSCRERPAAEVDGHQGRNRTQLVLDLKEPSSSMLAEPAFSLLKSPRTSAASAESATLSCRAAAGSLASTGYYYSSGIHRGKSSHPHLHHSLVREQTAASAMIAGSR